MARAKPVAKAPPAIAAWLVHAFTASGAVLALLALLAVEQQRWTLALAWLALSGVVDGVDGSLARWARVKERVPRIDGDTLDLVIDYLTYVFVPALFIWRAELVPAGLAPWLAAAILVSSLYVFARTDMKTDDGYFRGFPALWSVVAFYLFVLQPGATIGAAVVVLFVVMTFAPIHFAHPFRVRDYGVWLPAVAILWIVATCALLWPDWGAAVRFAISAVSVATAATLLAMGLLRSLRGR
ncbi:CDP-alcohol phosphatidyltransferase family protein [Sphingomonas sp.]|uniref:CDP-alcohol phosphatidyltransferase family protein n=1 Tax=Sphingomonas sp. TaxID=28214 RepID=UPI00185679CA|nr:CDP-alcohol phosphatidyltransferase family protein [Sphingomonas sp.]MBA3510908.1 phosphatidylcholine/phosphatidylserine synthase [Sphingomonas sp.]